MRIHYNMKYSSFISVTYYLLQHNLEQTDGFLISNFHRVLNVVCFSFWVIPRGITQKKAYSRLMDVTAQFW
jgi:hypothetical protein